MPRRVALLRAINVGGAGTLKMDALRRIAAELGFSEVTTIGASGNLVYDGKEPMAKDRAALHMAVSMHVGKPVEVMMRSQAHMKKLVKEDPFRMVSGEVPPNWRFTGFLARPTQEPLPEIPSKHPLVLAQRRPQEICYALTAPERTAIDWPKLVERTLGVAMTTRNWNVVNKLAIA